MSSTTERISPNPTPLCHPYKASSSIPHIVHLSTAHHPFPPLFIPNIIPQTHQFPPRPPTSSMSHTSAHWSHSLPISLNSPLLALPSTPTPTPQLPSHCSLCAINPASALYIALLAVLGAIILALRIRCIRGLCVAEGGLGQGGEMRMRKGGL